MSAATGPICGGGCGKRIPRTRPTFCPFCRLPLCVQCVCPRWAAHERLLASVGGRPSLPAKKPQKKPQKKVARA